MNIKSGEAMNNKSLAVTGRYQQRDQGRSSITDHAEKGRSSISDHADDLNSPGGAQ